MEKLELSQQVANYKQIEAALRQQSKSEELVFKFSQKLCSNLNIEEFLSTLVKELRQFIVSDRVLLYRFHPDWSGSVAFESVAVGCKPLLGMASEDYCFKENYVQYYIDGRVRVIEDIYTAGLTSCHIDFLAQLQVRANLVVPVVQGQKLWGLLIAQQCHAPRHWQQMEINLLKQLANIAAIAIQTSELYQQLLAASTERSTNYRRAR